MHDAKWAPLISRLIDGDLNERERDILLQHTQNCVICRETEGTMRRVVAIAVEARTAPLPVGDWNPMRARIDRLRHARSGMRSRVVAAALAASVAAAVTLGTIELRLARKVTVPSISGDSISAAARLRELERDILEIEALLKTDPANELARQLHARALEIRATRLQSTKFTPSHLE